MQQDIWQDYLSCLRVLRISATLSRDGNELYFLGMAANRSRELLD